jgi:hypothetical protein
MSKIKMMDMDEMMDMVNRFKNMDMSALSIEEAKRYIVKEAKEHGADEVQAKVIVDNVFPVGSAG